MGCVSTLSSGESVTGNDEQFNHHYSVAVACGMVTTKIETGVDTMVIVIVLVRNKSMPSTMMPRRTSYSDDDTAFH